MKVIEELYYIGNRGLRCPRKSEPRHRHELVAKGDWPSGYGGDEVRASHPWRRGAFCCSLYRVESARGFSVRNQCLCKHLVVDEVSCETDTDPVGMNEVRRSIQQLLCGLLCGSAYLGWKTCGT